MKIHVTCSKDYDIYLQKGLLEQIHNYIDCQRKIFIISDDNVPECYQQTVSKQFPNSYLHIVTHGEGAKKFCSNGRLFNTNADETFPVKIWLSPSAAVLSEILPASWQPAI
ncbi:MAG: hypothetical protein ACLU8S_05745 [Coprococcus phoceensis]